MFELKEERGKMKVDSKHPLPISTTLQRTLIENKLFAPTNRFPCANVATILHKKKRPKPLFSLSC